MATISKSSGTANPLPVYVIHGSEEFPRREALQALVVDLLGCNPDSMAIAEFDGDSAQVSSVLDECRTPSLLAPLRVVIVREADSFVSGGKEEEKADRGPAGKRRARMPTNRELLEKYLASPCPGGTLVLVCRSWPQNTKLYKIVAQVGRNIACEAIKAMAVPGWLTRRARDAYQSTLEDSAARRLGELVGPHLGLLDMELAKLAVYVTPRTTITSDDVDALVGASREEKVFRITDAVGRKDAGDALAVWQQVLATDRSAPYRAVGGLAYGFRRLTEAKRLTVQGVSLQNTRERLKIFEDAGSLKRQLDRFSLGEWEGHLGRLLKIDLGSKTGLGDVETGVEKFIVGLCS